jgi:hypothetical protein
MIISTRTRLVVALDSALAAAEAFHNEAKAQFGDEKKKWKRITGKRMRWEKRINERLGAVANAIEAMRSASTKL